ncbi:MAG TPA: translocation/assembly module TamB domain-containing protein [Deltaproteobacteria bacterium]|nr:translocation/assembly module TamB domain-containing protein [Deltaproteobacteria bacterium]
MLKTLKWFLAVIGAFVVLATAVLAAAQLYLSTDQGARRLLAVINTLYPGEITGSAVEVSLLSQEATVHDAVLTGPDGKRIITSERASLKMDLPALLWQELIFETIDVVKPDFVLELDGDGWLNIEAAFVEKTPGESSLNVYIHRLTCTDGTFSYRTRQGEPVVRLGRLDLLFDAAFERDSIMHFSSPKTDIGLSVSGRKIDLGSGSASCTIFNDQVRDIRAETAMGSTRMSLTGSITDMARKAQFNLDLALDGDMADLKDLLALNGETSGPIKGRITARRDYDDPDFTCALSYGGGTIEGLMLGRTGVEGTVTDRVATITNLTGGFASGTATITGTVDLRQVFPEGYFEGLKEEDAITYDLSITGNSLLLDDIPGLPKGFRGRISPRVTLKGSGLSADTVRLDAAFRAAGSGISAGPLLEREDLSLAGRISYAGGLFTIHSLDLGTRTATASASGTIRPASHAVDGTVTLRTPQAGPLLARTGIQGSGSLAATLRITGLWDRPMADIDAQAGDAVLQGVTLGSIDLKALLDDRGTLNISSCTLSNRASVLTVRGDVRLFRRFPDIETDPEVDLNMDVRGMNPADFYRTVPLAGAVDGRITAAGRISGLSAELYLTGKGLSSGDIRIGDAELAGNLNRGVLGISSLTVTNGRSTLRATGDMTLFDDQTGRVVPDPPIHLKVTGDGLFIDDFTAMAKGAMTFNADLAGTVRRPSGTATLLARDIDTEYQHFESLDIRLRSDGDIIWVDPAVLTVARGENINARGSVTLGGAYEFSLGTPGISIENLQAVKEYDSAKGTLFFHATGQGLLSNPSVSGRISAVDITFMDQPFDDMTFSFDLKDRKLSANGNWNFRINVEHDLATGGITAEALFAETELAPFFTLAGRKSLTGRLTGRMDMQGNVHALKDMDITAELSSLDIFHEGQDVILAHDVNASYRKGLMNLPLTRITFAQSGLIDIQAQGEVKKTLTLDAEGVIPMEVLGLFMEDLSDSSGMIRVSSQIRAQDLKPDVSALFTLEDLAWTIPANGQRLHSVNGKIDLRNNVLSTEGITGRLDAGAFQLGGTATFKGVTPQHMELLAQTKALPLSIPDMMDITIDAEASLDVNGMASRFWSDAVILDGTYYRDVNVNLFTGVLESIITRQQRERPKKQALHVPWPFLNATVLDVSIKRRGDVKVENNIATLDINPDLKITGTLANPVLNGRIAVTEGVVTFQNNDFTVSKGVIDFLDPYRTRANVDIEASTQVRTWDITLSLEGELDNLQLTLSSVPAEEPADILSLLIVGKTSLELSQAQSSVAVSPSGMMAELLTSTYGSDIKKATTLDILELKASDFATSTGGESMTLTVGKELSRRMTVKYEMETRNTETIQKAIAEYKILENLLLNGYQSSDGTFGADMLYRYEFR